MKHFLNLILIVIIVGTISGQCFASSKNSKLSCFGTEPFWSIKVDQGRLVYKNLSEDHLKIYENLKIKNAIGSSEDYAFQLMAENESNGIIKLNVIKIRCNDGMSDDEYTYTAILDLEGEILTGCCN